MQPREGQFDSSVIRP
nr:unnamed protein product [Callosobruchus chinensis]